MTRHRSRFAAEDAGKRSLLMLDELRAGRDPRVVGREFYRTAADAVAEFAPRHREFGVHEWLRRMNALEARDPAELVLSAEAPSFLREAEKNREPVVLPEADEAAFSRRDLMVERTARNAALLDLKLPADASPDERDALLDEEWATLEQLAVANDAAEAASVPIREKTQVARRLSGKQLIWAREARAKGEFQSWMDPNVRIQGCARYFLQGWEWQNSYLVPVPFHKCRREKFAGIATVAPCGHCELCALSRKARFSGAIQSETLTGGVVVFWTFTFARDGGDPSFAAAWKAMEAQRMRLRINLQRNMNYSLRWVVAPEPHKDGVCHFHAISFGLDPRWFADLGNAQVNEYGCAVYRAHKGVAGLWPHGRTEAIVVPQHGHPSRDRLINYIAKYAAKGATVTDEMRYWMVRRGDAHDWAKCQISWPRPYVGSAGVPALVSENKRELERQGLKALPFAVNARMRCGIADEMKKQRAIIFLPFGTIRTVDYCKDFLAEAAKVHELRESELEHEYQR